MSDLDVRHRDCFESLSAARDAGGADLVLFSPPYPDARDQYGAHFDTTLAGYRRLGNAIFEALRLGGVCAMVIDGPIRVWRPEIGQSERSLISFEIALDWAKRVGFRYIERCIYAREGVPGAHGPRWRSGGELVHVFSKPGDKPYFDRWGCTLAAKNPARRYSPGTARTLRGRTPRGSWVQDDRRTLTTVLACSVGYNKTDSDHPAPFAAALADAFVLCYCRPGGLVCDPFCGSGTVPFSCARHNRDFVGGDLGVRTHRTVDGRKVPCGRPWADIVNDRLRQTTLF